MQGVVTGIMPYGAFVRVNDEIDGLIHISEINDGYVNDVNYYVKQGEKVVVKIVDIDKETNHLKLSLKAIQPSRRHKTPKKIEPVPLVINFDSLKEQLPIWIKEETK